MVSLQLLTTNWKKRGEPPKEKKLAGWLGEGENQSLELIVRDYQNRPRLDSEVLYYTETNQEWFHANGIPTTPLKTNMSPENQWLEDVFPTEIVLF